MCHAKKISPDEVRRLIAPGWSFAAFAREIVEIYRSNEDVLRAKGLDVDGMLADLETQLDEGDTGSNVWRTVVLVKEQRRRDPRVIRRLIAIRKARSLMLCGARGRRLGPL